MKASWNSQVHFEVWIYLKQYRSQKCCHQESSLLWKLSALGKGLQLLPMIKKDLVVCKRLLLFLINSSLKSAFTTRMGPTVSSPDEADWWKNIGDYSFQDNSYLPEKKKKMLTPLTWVTDLTWQNELRLGTWPELRNVSYSKEPNCSNLNTINIL